MHVDVRMRERLEWHPSLTSDKEVSKSKLMLHRFRVWAFRPLALGRAYSLTFELHHVPQCTRIDYNILYCTIIYRLIYYNIL